LRNTNKSFNKFGGVLSTNDQEIAERIFKEAEEAVGADAKEPINKALTALERIAGQLTAAMMDPKKDSSSSEDEPANEYTKF